MKKVKVFKYISNISFALGALLGAIALYFIISARVGLPSGTCPVNNNLPFIIPALALLLVSFVTSFFAEKKSKGAGVHGESKNE